MRGQQICGAPRGRGRRRAVGGAHARSASTRAYRSTASTRSSRMSTRSAFTITRPTSDSRRRGRSRCCRSPKDDRPSSGRSRRRPRRRALALADATFIAELQQAFGLRLGRFTRVGRRQSYPLALTRSERQTAPRAVVIGNAAQGLHPVAGQGFNLGLRDVATLAEVLADAIAERGTGVDPGAPRCSIATRTGASRTGRRSSASPTAWCAASVSRSRRCGRARDGAAAVRPDAARSSASSRAARWDSPAASRDSCAACHSWPGHEARFRHRDRRRRDGGCRSGGTPRRESRRRRRCASRCSSRSPRRLPAAGEPLDLRVSALSRASQRLLELTGAWPAVVAARRGGLPAHDSLGGARRSGRPGCAAFRRCRTR